MASSPSTFMGSSSPAPPGESALDLSSLPPIYILPTHLSTDELHDIEDQVQEHGGALTYDISEARIVLGRISTKKRAELELRVRKLWTEEVIAKGDLKVEEAGEKDGCELEPPRKKIKKTAVDKDEGSTTEEEDGNSKSQHSQLSFRFHKNDCEHVQSAQGEESHGAEVIDLTQDEATARDGAKQPDIMDVDAEPSINISVIKLQWFQDSMSHRKMLGLAPYLIYEGQHKMHPPAPRTPPRTTPIVLRTSPREAPKSQQILADKPIGAAILERARADAGYVPDHSQDVHNLAAPHGARKMTRAGSTTTVQHHASAPKPPAKLAEMTTEEFEGTSDQEMPPPPDWVKRHVLYACQRSTPKDSPNDPFIDELKKIRLARILTNDEIGVRAYSTSIASLAAYPYKIVNPREILRLPGCDVKLANLWIEWKNSGGKIKSAEEAQNDPTLKILNLFYEIWGVGATTAREFYYDKGWNDLDDIVEYGWNTLNRVQQIGVKYYDEFQQKIPRSEVETIAEKVREHAIKVRDDGIELIVVGGYRRGKEESGDVDMIVSHRHLDKTAGLVQDIVESLEQEGWITHTLSLSLTSTHRNQATLPFKVGVASHGAGFDTLDKALVVWQDPVWPGMEEELAADPKAKNPNVHRRVDIIVSPWRTVGCAVTGWTSGTTFQRDLRRYARNVKGWKFDSSGVRDRRTGEVVELEGPEGVSGSMVDAEKKVFEGFGLEYREPWERCTG